MTQIKELRFFIGFFFLAVFVSSPSKFSLANQDEKANKIQDARNILLQASQIANQVQDVSEYGIMRGMFNVTPVEEKIKLLNMIAIAQAAAGDRGASRETFQMTFQLIHQIKDGYIRTSALKEVLNAQATAGDVEGAARTVELIQDPADKHFPLINIAAAQFESKDFDGARATLRKAYQIAEPKRELHIALYFIGVAQARIGDIKGAAESEKSVDQPERIALLSEIAAAYLRAGNKKDAFGIVDRANNVHEKAVILRKIALAQSELNPGVMDSTLLASLEMVWGSQKPNPNDDLNLAESYSMAGQPEQGFQIASNIQDEQIKINTLRRMMDFLIKKGDAKRVDSYFHRATEIAKGIKTSHLRRQALQNIARQQLYFGGKAASLKTAALIIEDREPPTVYELTNIAQIQKDAGDSDAAKRTVQRAIRSMKESRRPVGLDYIVRMQIKLRDVEGAVRLINSLEYTDSSALIELASGQIATGDLKGAFDTIAPIQGLEMRATALRRLAQSQADTGNGPGVELSLQQASLLAQAIKDERRRVQELGHVMSDQWTAGFVLENLAKQRAKQGESNRALEVSDGLTFPYLKARTLLGVARGILEGMGLKEHRLIELFDPGIV